MTIQVGSIVRAPRDVAKLKGRAVVALVEDDDSGCILWQDLAPRPLLKKSFIVTPTVPQSKEEREDTVALSTLQQLLEFEEIGGDECSVEEWKKRGDALLRLGDGCAAIPYYEAGLSTSSVLQVGCSGLVSIKDGFQVAEVDYLEGDGNADVTIGDQEQTLPTREIQLCLLAGQETLQVRILLNLARCLMQVGDLEDSQLSAYYRRSAATACSMAIAILSSLDRDDNVDSLNATALLLRSKAYASRSKWKAAMADAQALTKDYQNHKEGRAWMNHLESQMKQTKKTNQKLAKSMCAWVQNATATSEAPSSGPSVSSGKGDEQSLPSSETRKQSPLTLFWYLLLPFLLALWVHRLVTSHDRSR